LTDAAQAAYVKRKEIMKLRQGIVATTLLLATVATSGTALADRGGGHYGGRGGGHYGYGHGHVGAVVGGAIIAGALLSTPWVYPRTYYYPAYPAVVEVAPPAPTVYIEQPRAVQPAVADAGSWWYYCKDSAAYYPYVRECASPWQQVSPTPPASR